MNPDHIKLKVNTRVKRSWEILEAMRKALIDKALDDGDKERFMELTSEGWEDRILSDNKEREEDKKYREAVEELHKVFKPMVLDTIQAMSYLREEEDDGRTS